MRVAPCRGCAPGHGTGQARPLQPDAYAGLHAPPAVRDVEHLLKLRDRADDVVLVDVLVRDVGQRRGRNVAAVALANKNARTAWAVLRSAQDYDAEHLLAPDADTGKAA